MFFVEDGRCDSLAIGLLPITVREVAFPTKGLDFVVMSVCSGLSFYKDVCPEAGGAVLYYRTGPPRTGGEFQRGSIYSFSRKVAL